MPKIHSAKVVRALLEPIEEFTVIGGQWHVVAGNQAFEIQSYFLQADITQHEAAYLEHSLGPAIAGFSIYLEEENGEHCIMFDQGRDPKPARHWMTETCIKARAYMMNRS